MQNYDAATSPFGPLIAFWIANRYNLVIMKELQLPLNIKKYLWDTDLKSFSFGNSSLLIERLLEFGDEKAIKWLFQNFSKENIILILKKSRKISPKTGNFFAWYFGIKPEEFLCIQKPFIQRQARF